MRDNTILPRLVVVTSSGLVGREVVEVVVVVVVVGGSVVVVGVVVVHCIVVGVIVVVGVVVVVGIVVLITIDVEGKDGVVVRLVVVVVVVSISSWSSIIEGSLITSSKSALTTVATPKALLSLPQVSSRKINRHFLLL